MALDPKKASNALVAVVDLYSAIIVEMQGTIAEQAKVIQRLGEQIRRMGTEGGSDGRSEQDNPGDGR